MKAVRLSERRKFQLIKNKDIISVEFQSIMKQIFLIIALSGFSAVASAQIAPCNLRLDVYKFQTDAEPTEIKNAAVFLQKEKSKAKIKPSMQNEMPHFANLPVGNYSAVVSMSGYKITNREIRLDCSMADELNVVSEVLFLWEGDTKESVKMNDSDMAIGSDSSPNKQTENYNKDSDSKSAINGKAAYLPKPVYPRAARAVKATGEVQIQVVINEIGKVVYAKAVSGHPMLQAAAIKAAKEAKFSMTLLQGMPVKVSGIITYNFVP